jgi:hypothetical protein
MLKRQAAKVLLEAALINGCLLAISLYDHVLFGFLMLMWCYLKTALSIAGLCLLPFTTMTKQEQTPS